MTAVYCSILLLLAGYFTVSESATGYGPGEQDWGYVDVREGAHMFYWLYYTTANVSTYTERPLTIWLQGGPGASSTGIGNFEEFGTLDLNGMEREWAWAKDVNVLFIDNPVGSGFSYVDSEDLFPKTNNEVALDLVALMKGFYAKHPEFETVPLHIFCESYGGKMSPEFALELYRAIQRGEVRSNLKSVILGDPWTSPIDSVMAWGPLLLNMGILDYDGYNKTMRATNRVKELVDNGEWDAATEEWSIASIVVSVLTEGVDFYNIARKTSYFPIEEFSATASSRNARPMMNLDVTDENDELLRKLMQGPVTTALDINVTWGYQRNDVFRALSTDFMKPAVDIVVALLETTDLEVGILTGQLDLICATLGTVNFVENMQWSYKADYVAAPRQPIVIDGVLEGYYKSAGNFKFFWANRAGHMVPADNPSVMDFIIKYYTKYDQPITSETETETETELIASFL